MATSYLQAVSSSIIDRLSQVEEQLLEVDKLLDQVQPPHTGRIRLMWITRMSRGWLNERSPVPAIWSRSKLSGRWTAKQVPIKGLTSRVKSSGEFAATTDQAREVVACFAELLDLHGRIRKHVTEFDRRWLMADKHIAPALDDVAARALKLMSRARLAR